MRAAIHYLECGGQAITSYGAASAGLRLRRDGLHCFSLLGGRRGLVQRRRKRQASGAGWAGVCRLFELEVRDWGGDDDCRGRETHDLRRLSSKRFMQRET